jgi:hypothetical protein
MKTFILPEKITTFPMCPVSDDVKHIEVVAAWNPFSKHLAQFGVLELYFCHFSWVII